VVEILTADPVLEVVGLLLYQQRLLRGCRAAASKQNPITLMAAQVNKFLNLKN
jgi:hypothetical protein